MNLNILIPGLSLAIQLASIYFSMRLLRFAEKKAIAAIFVLVFSLMAIRRAFPLVRFYNQETATIDLPGEFVGVFVSLLILYGIILITRAFKEAEENKKSAASTETRYRTLFDQSPDGILLMGATGDIVEFNNAVHEQLGFTREEFRTLRIADIDPVESPADIEARFGKVMQEGKDQFEVKHRTKQGDIRDVLVIIQKIELSGQPFFHTIWRDITRRKRSESFLRTRFELSEVARRGSLDELLQHALDAAELHTASSIGFFHFVDADQEHLTLQAWSTNTLGKMCTATGKGTHYAISQAGVWADCFRAGQPVIHNDYASLPNKKGMPEGHAPVSRELAVPISRDGKVVAIVGVGNKPSDYVPEDVETVRQIASLAMDLVYHLRAEQALQESERRFRTLADHAPVGIFQTDARGGCIYVNKTWCTLAGLTAEQALGAGWAKAVHPDDVPTIFKGWSEGDRARRESSLEYRFVTPSGAVNWVSGTATALTANDGTVIGYIGSVIDITARKAAEQEMEQFHTFFETASDLMCIANPNGAFLRTNPACTQVLGYSAEELVSKPFIDFVHPDDKQQTLDEMARQIRIGASLNFENRYRCKDGSLRVLSWRATYKKDEGITYAVARDITLQKQREMRLLSVMKAVESASDAIGISDAQGRHFYQNRALSDLFGYATAEELDAAGGGPAVVKDPAVAKAMFNAIMQGQSWVGELEMVTKSGRVFPALERADAIKDRDGKLIGLVGIITDITERKRTEEALLYFQMAVGSATDAIAMSTPGGKHYYQNEAFTKLFGLSVSEVQGESGPTSLYVDAQVGRNVFATIMQGGSFAGEIKMFNSQRQELDIDLRAYSIKNSEGRVVGLVGMHADVTERKRTEERIQRSLKEKEVLLKEIHHRVKNNMQVIYSLLNLQAKNIEDKAVRDMFDVSRNRVSSMSLIHEKLYRSADLAHINFNEYLQSLVSGVAATYKRPEVVCTVDREPIALDVNVGIPCGLIVNELVSNCFKYAFPDGRAGALRVGLHKSNAGDNVLTVADNGIGFPESVDFQNTASLGLQLVNVLVKQIHGTIALSRAGGTEFRITFPGEQNTE